MTAPFRRVLLLFALFVGLTFTVLLVNQTAQLVQLAAGIHPLAGQGTFWALIFLYLALGLVPLILFLRLPRPLVPPEDEESPRFEAHLERLGERLRRNPTLAGQELATREDVESALRTLDAQADGVIRSAGSQVFLTTAISQNGALDSLLVLSMQSRMVWQIAQIYYQRPTLRDLIYLYSNVITTAFVAGELDEIDLAAQIQPVLSSVMGSAAGVIPGFQVASAVLVNSVFSGTTNAFLTLRVGLITRGYCRALVRPEKRGLRHSAIGGATGMLGGIAMEGARKVSGAFVRASARSVGGMVRGAGGKTLDAGSAVVDWMKFWDRDEPEPEGT